MKILTYDSTLRDGEQCEGITLSLEDKLRIVERLDALGIDFIEGGFPASNPKDIAFFQRVQTLPLRHARIAAFGSTCKKGVAAEQDQGLADLVASGAPVATIVGKTWDAQVTRALQTTLEENLRMIRDSVVFLKRCGLQVVFDAEHYFDGYAANAEYALACVRAASEAGADSVDLCETNGGALPFQVEEVVRATAAAVPGQQLGIHCHNDSGCAVANALAAVRAGAVQVQGTVNGFGERVGNTDLLTVIADLELKMGMTCVGRDNLRQLTSVAQFVAESCNMALPTHHPYTGASAFAHKGGLHASAIARFPEAYEHASPESVGNNARMLVSELAGKASLMAKARGLGIDLTPHLDKVQGILDDIKQREAGGYSYEVADGSLALLLQRHLGAYRPHFTLESFRVIVDDHEDTGALAKDAMSEATIKIHVGDRRFVATGEGAGPVGALDNALRMAIVAFYPQVADMELVDYKVRILDENVGTDAITRVVITTSDGSGSWGTVGVSENIIEASWNAIVDSIEYGLMKMGE
ncbi:citramalate synthase [Paraeggerthella hongkongensis]|uniref:citramalate synthase n=1 Tax=Paraeggerthella hominis TaxID=2897351 RepID=UPI001C0F5CA1|nr:MULTISPECIES: citramalate synthase [Paraeggerthella]MBU5406618.1 citramalate synthase [Paraeggerthella hongkongensis]MCD2433284.1 citramalate synthase [Paraeggerthella hominis]